ncbi:MAG: hypothetical protein FWG37_02350 [Clostridia bacterium]|nr:hypothetical protein [Clostridia bacterium]
MTVRGLIAPDSLGFCQAHEHLSVESPHIKSIAPDQDIADMSRTIVDLHAYRQAGGGAIVDAQPVGAGRNGTTLHALSAEANIHVIASTGFHRMRYYPPGHWIFSADEDRLAALFTSELTDGMYLDGDERFPTKRSEIRAGQVKSALEPGPLDPRNATLFQAAARASINAGVPLMAHIESGSDPEMLADFLTECGLSPECIVFCHMDRTITDLEVHKAVCARGVALEYDAIARPNHHSETREIAIIREMLDAGYGDRLLAGLDVTRARLTGYGGSPGLAYILNSFVPALRNAGVPETAIARIFNENPARVWQSH